MLSNDIEYWLKKGATPFIAGDFNSRIGDINALSQKCLKWHYNDNVDNILNQHGKSLYDVCDVHSILPVNHSKYFDKQFDGCITYCKGGKKSQIDFLLTNNEGRRLISEFNIIQTGWHTSDHLPLVLKVKIPFRMNAAMLLRRSCELKPYVPSQQPLIKCHRYKFNEVKAHNDMLLITDELHRFCDDNHSDPELILQEVERVITPVLLASKMKKVNNAESVHIIDNAFEECDILFDKYTNCLTNNDNFEDIDVALSNYQIGRNNLNQMISKKHESEYVNILNAKDDHALWQRINWSGKLRNNNSKHPEITDLAEHFETLYQPMEENEMEKMYELRSNVYIPVNDDVIVMGELKSAALAMKKGGWDFSLPVLKLLMKCIPNILLLLMNLLFFCVYPLKLTLSILHAIPKTGNLLLCSNYRGIQMQQLFALLYDRIIAARLISWAKISYEQSAFQKGKSTLNHIFTLRILIALCKKLNKNVYIGFFDLSKAFDKVSRLELLKSLIKLGIGSCLLEAIKATYKVTRCALKGFGKISDVFITYSGIKQGAPSSVILFILFMDDVVEVLKLKCVKEFLIGNLHSLLHADDTLIFSLQRELFIKKCNVLIDTFHDKKLILNLKKSAFMIINADENESKTNIKLKSGWLPYRTYVVYLGALISDSGNIHVDIKLHAQNKDKAVSIKFSKFILNNVFSPITVKYKVLRSCVNGALLYGCETWGNGDVSKIETVHRKAIRTTLGVKSNTANDIVYSESGFKPLKATIRKRQFKFWKKINAEIQNNPDSPITLLYLVAIEKKIPFVKHYMNLHSKFQNENECYEFFSKYDEGRIKERLLAANSEDPEGIKGVYVTINPSLQCPQYFKLYTVNEKDRIILTKYRTGSHYLNMEKGRVNSTNRENRMCSCKMDVQSIKHVVFNCAITQEFRNFQYNTLDEFFADVVKAPHFLRMMEYVLKLQK